MVALLRRRFGSEDPKRRSGNEMALEVEGIVQRRVSERSVPRAGEAIQDQLNSNGIPRFLDFFSRLR
jgi:hypothetical protein